jgi:hypothetical protein
VRTKPVKEHVMPLGDVQLGWWIKLRTGRWAKLVPRDTVLAEDGRVTLMVPRLPDDVSGETLVTVAKRRPEGARGILAR